MELTHVASPSLRDGEMLVKVLACNLCRSDLHSHAGRRQVATPTILGHEIVGQIEEFGPHAPSMDIAGEPLAIGDRITWSIVLGCGRCYFCTHDLPQKCDRLFKYGHSAINNERSLGGGLADFVVLLPGTACLRVPNGMSDSVAALANCAAATAAAVLSTPARSGANASQSWEPECSNPRPRRWPARWAHDKLWRLIRTQLAGNAPRSWERRMHSTQAAAICSMR